MKIIRKVKNVIHMLVFMFKKKLKIGHSVYFYFPFDVSSPLPKGAVEVMQEGCALLKSLKVKYRLTDGTVLGLYRQGGFIPHDNDIDVDVFDMTDSDIENIKCKFKSKGFKLGSTSSYLGRIQQIIFFNNQNVIFDIVFWYSEPGSYVNFAEKGFVRRQDKKYFSELGYIVHHEINYPIPGHIEMWLVDRYGNDWGTPKTYKGDWKDDCFDIQRQESECKH